MNINRINGYLLAMSFLCLGSFANAYVVEQDGLGIDVDYTRSGQTLSFTLAADFTGATGSWLGDTMDSFSLQFAGNTGVISSYSATASTSSAGTWTGYKDKVSGNGCSSDSFLGAICYTVLPTASGADNAPIIASNIYSWMFDVTFENSFDVDDMLSKEHSIKFLSVKEKCKTKNGVTSCDWQTGSQLSQSGVFTTTTTTTVPEPASVALLALGLFGLGLARRNKLS